MTHAQDYTNQLKLTPLKLIDLTYPALELGYEKDYAKQHSVQLMIGYMHNFFGTSPFSGLKGYRLGLEQKYKLRSSTRSNNYIGAEFAVMKAAFNYSTSYTSAANPPATSYIDTFGVKKRSYSLNLKIGAMRTLVAEKITIDIYAGYGIKYKETTRSGVDDPFAIEARPYHPNIYYTSCVEGKQFAGNLILNLRLGYRF